MFIACKKYDNDLRLPLGTTPIASINPIGGDMKPIKSWFLNVSRRDG
jgi:hypothetical protein